MRIYEYIKNKILHYIKVIQVNLMWKHKNNVDMAKPDNKTYIPFSALDENLLHDVEWIDTAYGYFPYYKTIMEDKSYYVFNFNDITMKMNGQAIRILGVAKPLDSIN